MLGLGRECSGLKLLMFTSLILLSCLRMNLVLVRLSNVGGIVNVSIHIIDLNLQSLDDFNEFGELVSSDTAFELCLL